MLFKDPGIKIHLSLYLHMKRILLIGAIVILTLPGCKKNDGPKLSGTETIDNTFFGTGPYWAMGFSFSAGSKVSTLKSPTDVITINAFPGNFDKSYFDCQNFENSFFLFGSYSDATSALFAFKNLTSFSVSQWSATGDAVKPNQIWLFKTSLGTYSKFLIKSTVGEMRNNIPFVACTFDWVYQPDGSLTFPLK
jgi:hypothetical protein